MCRVQMHDCTSVRADVIDGEMQKTLLGLLGSADQAALVIEFGERCGIEVAKRYVRRCHQPAVVYAHANVARGTWREPAAEDAGAKVADCFASLCFSRIHLFTLVVF